MVHKTNFWKVLTRRKTLLDESAENESKLSRVLGLYDLTALGVGSTLGAGVYVLAGQIAKEQAGPSVMISFTIAALASLLAGLCYAEFGARVPKAGSAYVYSYVCIGEFVAFIIGWNLALEYMVGTASVCRGISLYLDTLLNDTLKITFAEIAPINVAFLGSYFDFLAFCLVIVFGVALAFGVEASALLNNFCTTINIFILLFVIIAGSIKANFDNWNIDPGNVNVTSNVDLGTGGFFPFGFQGTLKGAATCFFGFVGFDCIATTGEEVRDPRRNIPRSILLSLLLIFLFYFGVSTVLTLMVPYYLQDSNAPLPYAFKEVGWEFGMWIVSIGGLVGLCASLLGALFPLPRVLYSMAQDGLIFRFLGKINARFRAPVTGSIFAAIITALMAGFFDLVQLVHLLSIGTLLAYSFVAISITILRYMDNRANSEDNTENVNNKIELSENSSLTSPNATRITMKALLLQICNPKRIQQPNTISTFIVGISITIFCLISLTIGLLLMHAYAQLMQLEVWALTLLIVLIVLMLLVLIIICRQPRENRTHIFRVPFVPLVPAISIFINTYLMLQLDIMTWLRFGIWMIIGLPMFVVCWCKYDIQNPAKRNHARIEFIRALQMMSSKGFTKFQKSNNNNKSSSIIVGQSTETLKIEDPALINELDLQNEHSVKSLDEIVKLSEVSKDLIEMRHPNGKVFYIEDSRSNTSKTSASSSSANSVTDSDTTEEEKSVIAYLDYVLKAEDEEGLLRTSVNSRPSPPLYERKISVDSEMLPSVIETTTVATVHSSSGTIDQELEELTEAANEEYDSVSDDNIAVAQHDILTESRRIAIKLVDEIFEDERLLQALEEQAEMLEKETLRKFSSRESIDSRKSIENALHSEIFKNRLSHFLMKPPIMPMLSQKFTKMEIKKNNIDDKYISINDGMVSSGNKLRHSKREEKVHTPVFKAINNRLPVPMEMSETYSQIPRAPIFDAMLYNKSIKISQVFNKKASAGIQELLAYNNEKVLNDNNNYNFINNEITFKKRLENILQRGPDLPTQRPHSIILRTNSSRAPINHKDYAVKTVVDKLETANVENINDNTTKITFKPISGTNDKVRLIS